MKFFFAYAERSETFTTLGTNGVFTANFKFQTVSPTQKKFRVFLEFRFLAFFKKLTPLAHKNSHH